MTIVNINKIFRFTYPITTPKTKQAKKSMNNKNHETNPPTGRPQSYPLTGDNKIPSDPTDIMIGKDPFRIFPRQAIMRFSIHRMFVFVFRYCL